MRMTAVAALLSLLVAGPAMASLLISFDPVAPTVDVGDTVEVEMIATFSAPVVAWGLDLTIVDPMIASLTDIDIGASWDSTDTLDHDGLAGLRFATGVTGNVVLATLTFTGLEVGTTDLTLGYDGEDEGFELEFGGLDTDVTYAPCTVTVTPEPTTLALLSL